MNNCVASEERLRALQAYGILDTPPEERFDRITRHAAWAFDVPICLVSFVDGHRQWFKSRHGLEVEQTPLETAFCRYTIQEDRVLVVEDARADARFTSNPLVREGPGVRFYAGAPLRTPGGQRIGSLCLFDTRPRTLSPEAQRQLRALADLVEAELEQSRRTVETIREFERVQRLESRFHHLVQNGSDVITLVDASGTIQYQSPSITRVLGYDPDDLVGHEAFEWIHPDDRARVRRELEAFLRTDVRNTVATFRFRRTDGAWAWLEATATNLLDVPEVGAIVINSRDVTERKRLEARQHAEQRILEMIARRAPLSEVLDAICHMAEEQIPGALSSILLLDENRFWHGAAPSLPKDYCEAVDGIEAGPEAGSCGMAIYRRETVISTDIATDPKCEAYRDVVLAYGFRSCFSTPILARDGEPLGTFGIYYRAPQEPEEAHRSLVQTATYLAGIALENVRVERALHESDTRARRLAAVAARTTNAVLISDNDNRIEWVNEGFTRLYGLNPEDVIGKTPAEALGGAATSAEVLRRVGNALALRESITIEIANYCRDGRCVWVSVDIQPLNDPDGAPAGFMSIATDITAQKETEAALRESEARYRIIVERTGQLVYDTDVATGRIQWSGAVAGTTGFSPEAFSTFGFEEWLEHIHPDDRAAAMARLEQAQQTDGDFRVGYRFRDAHGAYRFIEDAGVYLPDDEGRPHRVLGVMRDMTERRQAEARVRESEGRYRALSALVSTFAFSYGVDEEGAARLEWLTDSVRDVMGYSPDELIGETWALRLHGDEHSQSANNLQRILAGQPVCDEMRLPQADGEMRWYRIVLQPEWDEALGRVARIYGAGQDITEQKRHEQELIEAKEKAEEMSRLKDAFLANMSHELRTPLTSIIGFSGLLSEEIDGEVKELAQMIHRSGERLKETLSSVLDLAQLESGVLRLRPARMNLAVLAQETVELFQREARAKGLALTFEPGGGSAWASLDRGAVVRILHNLVSNALKFTHEGGVTISVGQQGPSVRLRVADTGVGISSEFLPHLFDDFTQESSGLARDFEGSGLGLGITRRLVGLMGGEISVESEKGRGSVFTVTFPTAPAE